jgi:hypothetical protein
VSAQSYNVEGLEPLKQKLRDLGGRKLLALLKVIINKNAILLTSRLRDDDMRTKLHVRSGQLRATTHARPTTSEGTTVTGGVAFGKVYARVHIGPRGQVTTITPKRAKFLTIPLKAAQTATGVGRGGALSGAYAKTFVRMSKAGNLIIFGQGTYAKGAKSGQAKGNIVPLFLLKKSVRVPARIHPEDFFPPTAQRIKEDLATAVQGVAHE